MIGDNLKDSILQIVSQGKLVKQSSSSSAVDELKSILEDTKDDKKYTYKPIESIPFEIPSNWLWVKLEDICLKITDGTHSTPRYSVSGIPFISVKDVSSGYISFENTKFITEEEHKLLYSRCNPENGDLLITKVGTTGVPAIVDTDKQFSLFVSVALLKINCKKIYNKYLYYILQSPIVQKQVKENTRGVGNKNWVLDAIKNTMIPLPPFEEQNRIVTKIEELFIKLQELEPIENELLQIKKSFPIEMKNSIINYGIKGFLTSHNLSDNSLDELIEKIKMEKQRLIETGEFKQEKGFKKSSDFEKPFDIPNNWRFVCLNELIVKKIDNRGKTPNNSLIKNSDYVELLEINSLRDDGSIDRDVCKKFITTDTYNQLRDHVQEKDILIATVGSLGKFGYMDGIVSGIAQNLIGIRCNNKINSKYIFYVLKSPYFFQQMNSIKMEAVQASVKVPHLLNLMIPLPPFEEQNRIVDKIEQLLPLCNDIERLVNS